MVRPLLARPDNRHRCRAVSGGTPGSSNTPADLPTLVTQWVAMANHLRVPPLRPPGERLHPLAGGVTAQLILDVERAGSLLGLGAQLGGW